MKLMILRFFIIDFIFPPMLWFNQYHGFNLFIHWDTEKLHNYTSILIQLKEVQQINQSTCNSTQLSWLCKHKHIYIYIWMYHITQIEIWLHRLRYLNMSYEPEMQKCSVLQTFQRCETQRPPCRGSTALHELPALHWDHVPASEIEKTNKRFNTSSLPVDVWKLFSVCWELCVKPSVALKEAALLADYWLLAVTIITDLYFCLFKASGSCSAVV